MTDQERKTTLLIFELIDAARLPDETWFQAARRLGANGAILSTRGNIRHAANLLGITSRYMCSLVNGEDNRPPLVLPELVPFHRSRSPKVLVHLNGSDERS